MRAKDIDITIEMLIDILDRNITPRRIQQLAAAGKWPKNNGKNQYPLIASIQFYINYLKAQTQGLNEEKRELIRIKIEKLRVEKQLLEGSIWDVEETKQVVMAILNQLKIEILGISGRLASVATGKETGEIKAMLDEELRRALNNATNAVIHMGGARETDEIDVNSFSQTESAPMGGGKKNITG